MIQPTHVPGGEPVPIVRCRENPIVTPGLYDWRMATVFNPGVLHEGGRFYMYERAAGGLRPFICSIGLLASDDGVHFTHVSDQPVFTPEMAGSKYGSVQDPRVVKIDGVYYMTYAYRPFAWSCNPTGVGVPESYETSFPGFSGRPQDNQTRSGIAVSRDRVHWEHLCWPTPPELDDRDVILFPRKIGGRFALLRRPLQYVGERYGTAGPGIWICFSDDLQTWTAPVLLAAPAYQWEDGRIGGSAPPVWTPKGWLVLYHGVQSLHAATRRVAYRLGAMMLDLEDPTRVIARLPHYIMEPHEYYERFGLFIPNTIFPTAAVDVNGLLHIYYGVCDTAIALATVKTARLVEHVLTEGK